MRTGKEWAVLPLLWAACAEESPARQIDVVVAVDADEAVRARLARIDGTLYAADGDDALHSERFELGVGAGKTGLPFSFVLTRRIGTTARLELTGHGASGDAPLIERKLIVSFAAVGSVSLRLSAACLDQLCEDRGQTCVAESSQSARCEAVSIAESDLPFAEVELDASPGARADASQDAYVTPMTADAAQGRATVDAHPDAQPDALVAPPASDDASVPPAPVRSCPADHLCTQPGWLCLASDKGDGYSCPGAYAAWPMPDSTAGAKVAPRYTVRSSGVVLDEITGLAWQRARPASYPNCTGALESQNDSCSHAEALQYCEQLALDGQRWRLPSKLELESLLMLRTPGSPAASRLMIDTSVFTESIYQPYWSSTPDAVPAYAGSYWTMSFVGGSSLAKAPDISALVRCVRSERAPNAPPDQRFKSADGVVRDAFTTLEWAAKPSEQASSSLADARAYCSGLAGGFRVPTYKEMLTLANPALEVAVFRDFFTQLAGSGDWLFATSSRFADDSAVLYSEQLGMGVPSELLQEGMTVHVRCVR